jgi:hypothetical protein
VSSVQQNSKRCAIGIVIHSRHQIHQLARVAKIDATMTSTSLSLLPSDAATHDRDMIGASYHRQVTQLRYSGDLFDTTIVVSSQGYVKYGTPADSIKIYCYLRASYHQYTIAMALASYFLLDIYVKPPWVSFVRQFGSAYHSKISIQNICIKNIGSLHPPIRT